MRVGHHRRHCMWGSSDAEKDALPALYYNTTIHGVILRYLRGIQLFYIQYIFIDSNYSLPPSHRYTMEKSLPLYAFSVSS